MTIQRLGQCGQSITNEAFQRLYVVATYTPHVIAGGGSLLIVWKAYFAARVRLNPSVNEWSEKTQRTLQRRLRMAKMLLLTFAWTMFCNVPYFVIVGQFAWLLDANPISGLWQQVASTSQYAFTPIYRKTSLTAITFTLSEEGNFLRESRVILTEFSLASGQKFGTNLLSSFLTNSCPI
ncbi:hypothetical protein BV898_13521 [Hypsibius exemplaris]|uniref:Uncharacterized protein n=1 Tax=Hypsibius exemplaris TaxID=2072580 RepID=A0A1W0WAE3_HYPEX|nr:hypothetical protein BV898_13521 [Hypsibius exemplaris]